MNTEIRDVAAMKALRPLEIAQYLRSAGWGQRETASGNATIWTRTANGEEFEALLPVDQAIGDFALRMGDLLRVLAVVERRPETQVYSDLLTTCADIVRIQIEDSELQDGTVPMEVNAQIAQRTRDLILAAACAATENRVVWHQRKPNQAVDYLRKVRIGQTERGSYVVTVLSRVSPLLHVADGKLFEADIPYERRVIQTLAGSLAQLESAAEKAALSGEFASFDDAVARGVNANLCDAVAGLWGEDDRQRTLRFSFSWSPARPVEANVNSKVSFTADRIPVIREAARLMRERAPVGDFELEGAVVKLQRAEGQPIGRVTILGHVEGKPRHVALELGDPHYHTAVLAHDQGKALRCIGSLVREGRGFVLQGPREIGIEDE